MSAADQVGRLARIGDGDFERHLVEPELIAPAAGNLFEGRTGNVEFAPRDRVESMTIGPGAKDEGQQHRVVDRSGRYVVAGQELHVVLDIVADLEDRGVLQQRSEQRQRHLRCERPWRERPSRLRRLDEIGGAVAHERHVDCAPRSDRQRDTHQPRAHRRR